MFSVEGSLPHTSPGDSLVTPRSQMAGVTPILQPLTQAFPAGHSLTCGPDHSLLQEVPAVEPFAASLAPTHEVPVQLTYLHPTVTPENTVSSDQTGLS